MMPSQSASGIDETDAAMNMRLSGNYAIEMTSDCISH
jgi:hypothetical protein